LQPYCAFVQQRPGFRTSEEAGNGMSSCFFLLEDFLYTLPC
jgi:hypothetical protein